jgi:hypothetical protein
MTSIPEVVEARPVGHGKAWLRFAGGQHGVVDLSGYADFGPIFRPLADESFFRQLRVEGGTIAWPNGADIAPERLHELLVGYAAHDSDGMAKVAEETP